MLTLDHSPQRHFGDKDGRRSLIGLSLDETTEFAYRRSTKAAIWG
jgi:hypothetical protein